jgi:hypothetical protein
MSHKEKRFDSIVVDKKNIQLNQMLNKALGGDSLPALSGEASCFIAVARMS